MPSMLISSIVSIALLASPLAPNAQQAPQTPAAQVADRTERVEGELGKKVDGYLQSCEALGFHGAVLVQKGDQVLVRKGYGTARWETNRPNSPTTLYDIASASKQITAAAILKLESQGKIDTSESIAKYLPNVPKKHKDVTVYHLLTHTSGFSRYGQTGSGKDLEKALANYLSAERKGKAGKRFEYYNGGYAMLAMMVEHVTNEPFEKWVSDNLFQPAGMKYTYFMETMGMDEAHLSAAYNSYKLTTSYIRGWGYRGMGGVVTSVADLGIWCNALFKGKVLPKDTLEKMLTPNKENYGCGWVITKTEGGRRVIQHGGNATSFESYIRYFPDDDLLVIVLTNRPGWHYQVAWEIPTMILNEPRNQPAIPQAASLTGGQMNAFCGVWEDKGRRIVVQPHGYGFEIGALDYETKMALMGRKPEKPNKDWPKKKEVERLGELGMEIVANLRKGDVSLIKKHQAAYIPESWSQTILNMLWPEHLERWGPVKDQEFLSSHYDPDTKWVHVWIRLNHENAQRSIRVSFFGDRIKIFSLGAPNFPYATQMIPVESEFAVAFDYGDKPPATLKLNRGRLELKSRSGAKFKFNLVD